MTDFNEINLPLPNGWEEIRHDPSDMNRWFTRHIAPDPNSMVSFLDLHNFYKHTCVLNGMLPFSRNKFARALRAYMASSPFDTPVEAIRTDRLYYKGVRVKLPGTV